MTILGAVLYSKPVNKANIENYGLSTKSTKGRKQKWCK